MQEHANTKGVLDLPTILKRCHEGLSEVFHDTWSVFVAKVKFYMAKAQFSIAEVTGGIFTSEDDFQSFSRLRSAYMLGMLRSLTCGANSVLQNDRETSIAWLDEKLEEVGCVDAALPCDCSGGWVQWVQGWVSLLNIAAKGDEAGLAETAALIKESKAKPGGGELAASTAVGTPSSSGAPAMAAAPAPTAAPPGAPSGPTTLAALRKLWQCPSTATGPIIQSFMMHLELFIYDNCVIKASCGPTLFDLKFDGGLEDIVADSSAANPELKATIINKNLNLNFTGKVSRLGQKGCLKVAEAFGMPFYLHGRGFDSLSGSDAFVPAWMVKEANKDPVLEIKTIERLFTYKYQMFMSETSITVPVTCFCLRPTKEAIGKTDVVLTRPPFPANAVPHVPNRRSSNPVAARSAKTSLVPTPFKEAKHLFR